MPGTVPPPALGAVVGAADAADGAADAAEGAAEAAADGAAEAATEGAALAADGAADAAEDGALDCEGVAALPQAAATNATDMTRLNILRLIGGSFLIHEREQQTAPRLAVTATLDHRSAVVAGPRRHRIPRWRVGADRAGPAASVEREVVRVLVAAGPLLLDLHEHIVEQRRCPAGRASPREIMPAGPRRARLPARLSRA